ALHTYLSPASTGHVLSAFLSFTDRPPTHTYTLSLHDALPIFLANWNSFLWPLVATTDQDLQVVQLGIVSFFEEHSADWNYVLAAAFVAAIPTLIIFGFFQRKIVESVKTSGMK